MQLCSEQHVYCAEPCHSSCLNCSLVSLDCSEVELKPAVAPGRLCLCQPYQQSPQLGSALTLSSTLLHHCLNTAAIRATISVCLGACVCVSTLPPHHGLEHEQNGSVSKSNNWTENILYWRRKISPHGVSVREYLCAIVCIWNRGFVYFMFQLLRVSAV